MIRPKLDARSYTNLILVTIAVLLALSLMAQQPARSVYTDEAVATQQVAEAVAQVAQANLRIAHSLSDVAEAIREAADRLSEDRSGAARPSAPTVGWGQDFPTMEVSDPNAPAAAAPAFEGTVEFLD